ncbi:MAG: cupin domain-containing protein [Selenomonadaceae bacterium]|nr:cupin domain-containing protein [Selenomonadaceae bacterium]
MQIVLLSGGSGKRLWPLSNDIRSKQFLRIFEDNGEFSSMIQKIFADIKKAAPKANITIAAPKKQLSVLINQCGKDISVSKEPVRRDTFPAIALASLYLTDIKKADKDEVAVFMPVDPYVELDFFAAVKKLGEIAETGDKNIMLMGIAPTYPSAKYGYIFPKTNDEISEVNFFKEKPDEETAAQYIKEGALWNSGVFAMKLSYITEKAEEILKVKSYEELYENYADISPISFDYAVVEREKSVGVLRYNGEWKDLGTWNTLTEVMEKSLGDVTLADTKNVHAINELDVPLLVTGIKDAVVVASANGILVSDKKTSSYIKPYVEKFPQEVRYTEKSWGDFKIMDTGENSLTIKVILNPGHGMHYHRHFYRDEVWTVTEGEGVATINGKKREVSAGDVMEIPRKTPHKLDAVTRLSVIEVQLGEDITVEDKEKL